MKVQIAGIILVSLLLCSASEFKEYRLEPGEPISDKPCAARQIVGKSVVCVCNDTYCDTITRQPPQIGKYVVYTSSQGGLRFKKSIENLLPHVTAEKSEECIPTLVLDPGIKYQTIEGFGGAVTDAAGINWMSLTEPVRNNMINSYFSDNGLQYTMIRVPIGGTDFSTHAYAYNELPRDDKDLSNFTLSTADRLFKIPMIKACMQASSAPVHIVATTWSPPTWMKTNNAYTGYSRLKPEYYQTYADYHYKFIENYATEGIPIWAITTTNEPTSGRIGFCNSINCLGWSASDLGSWIVNNLGPTIRNSTHKEVKILLGDDQRLTLPYWVGYLVKQNRAVLDYIDGVAVHYYTDFLAPAFLLSHVAKSYPDKILLATEACEGTFWGQKHVDIGSWVRAKRYILDIISDINHGVAGWIDWNMCLNVQGGPTYIGNFADSPIIVVPERNAFLKQPMFYAMGHMSKFVPRGSRRIKVTSTCHWRDPVSHVAFVTPYRTIVAVLYNNGPATTVRIQVRSKQLVLKLDANSISTVEIPEERGM